MTRTTLLSRAGRRAGTAALPALLLAILAGCGNLMNMLHGSDLAPPPPEEFGFGPRLSATGAYRAVIEPVEPIKVGKLHAWRVRIETSYGSPLVEGTVAVDGGMPQHRHGMPTRPRVTGEEAPGVYRVEGMKFSMGGWWEIRVHVSGTQGVDTITFNLDL